MNHSHRQLPPMAPHKRKFRDETFDFLKPSKTIKPPPSKQAKPMPRPAHRRAMTLINPSIEAISPPTQSNMLLAEYLAHEYITKGTLFGRLYDPAQKAPRANNSTTLADFTTMKEPSHGFVNPHKETAEIKLKTWKNKNGISPRLTRNQKFIEVSKLLVNGAHIPGIVNPSQLDHFLNLQQENK
uniref:uncharacterized protein LOC122606481 n=1 Tax=Erigeron canadensis TaxID=72917 RepID=UPI001CB9511C|nr:uncharacterized protein LOC122606481 [Erigeron canadensis]